MTPSSFVDTVHDGDAEEREDNARMAREKKIKGLIRSAIHRVGLELSHVSYAIGYEDTTREANVLLDVPSSGLSLSLLAQFQSTGLAHDYLISPGGVDLEVVFTVDPALDDAI